MDAHRLRLAAALIAACGPAGGCQETQTVESFPDSFVGVGLELTMNKRGPTVVRPIRGGPSEAAGIKRGDHITAVDGKTTDGMSLGDVVHHLRGEPDSQVTLTLDRKGARILVVLRRGKMTKKEADYKVGN